MGFFDDVIDFVTTTVDPIESVPEIAGIGIGVFAGGAPAIIETGWGTASGWLEGIDLSPPEIPTAPSFGGIDWGGGLLPDLPVIDPEPIDFGSLFEPAGGDGGLIDGGFIPGIDDLPTDQGLDPGFEPSGGEWGGWDDPWDDWGGGSWGCGTAQMEWELDQLHQGELFDWETGEWVPEDQIPIDVMPTVDFEPVDTGGIGGGWWGNIVDVVGHAGGTASEPGSGGIFDILDYVVEPATQIGGIDDVVDAVEMSTTGAAGGGFFDSVTGVGERFESDILGTAETVAENVAENVAEAYTDAVDDLSSTVITGSDSLLSDDMLLDDAATMQIAEQVVDAEPAMEYTTMAATDDFGEMMDLGDTAAALVDEEPAFEEAAYDAPAFEEPAFQETVVAFDEPEPVAFDEPAPVAVYEEPEPDLFSADVQSADATAASADALWDDLG